MDHNIKMRIAFLTPGWPASYIPNGIVTYVEKMRNGFIAQGIDVGILAWKVAEKKDITGIVNLEHVQIPFYSQLFSKILYCFSPDVVHRRRAVGRILAGLAEIQRSSPLKLFQMEETFGWAAEVQERISIPIVVRLHGPYCIMGPLKGDEEDQIYIRRIQHEREAILGATGLTCGSMDVLERVRDYYGINLDNAKVIPNPILPVAEELLWSNEKCEENTILFVGRFDRIKGADILINAFQLVLRKNKNAKLLFVGPDRGIKDSNGKEWKGLEYAKQILGKKQCEKNLLFLGHLGQEEICKLRQNVAVTVVCSRYENYPNVVLEAMNQGCPLVCSKVGGIPEIGKDERNCLMFENENIEELSQKILILLGNQKYREKLGLKAIKHVHKYYNISTIVKKTMNYYNTLL